MIFLKANEVYQISPLSIFSCFLSNNMKFFTIDDNAETFVGRQKKDNLARFFQIEGFAGVLELGERIFMIKCKECIIRCMNLINLMVLNNGPPVRDLIGPSPQNPPVLNPKNPTSLSSFFLLSSSPFTKSNQKQNVLIYTNLKG